MILIKYLPTFHILPSFYRFILINFMTYVKEWDLNATCKDKFHWMALIKKKGLVVPC